MYVVAGATGRVGSATARSLLSAGAPVRVLVRREADAEKWRSRGAQARIVALDDRTALADALHGCRGFFVLLPFDLAADSLELHADALITSIVNAIESRRVPHVVALSSAGADLAAGTGPITGLHRLEQALLAIGSTVSALRSGHFQEKVADVLGAAREDGIYPVFSRSADRPMSMVATRDLGAIAAELLLSPPPASEAVDVMGPSYTERDVAAVLGSAMGRELQVAIAPTEEWTGMLTAAGFPAHIADSLAELYRADDAGLLVPRGDRSIHAQTPIERTIAEVLGQQKTGLMT